MPVALKGSVLKKSLEPAILTPGLDDDQPHQVNPDHLLMSIAISAKRIADALEDGLVHLDSTSGGVFGLADIAANAGRKYEQG